MKFSQINPKSELKDAWIGISVRSQHYYANFNHLFYINAEGMAFYARPIDDSGNFETLELGKSQDFNINQPITFNIFFDDNELKIDINDITKTFDIMNSNDMPYCYIAGKIRFQTNRARAYIKSIFAEYPTNEISN